VADNTFRTYRSRETPAPDRANQTASERSTDPLAELARLIGQTDPYAEGAHEADGRQGSGDDTAASELDWAASQRDVVQHDRTVEADYVSPPATPPAPPPRAGTNRAYASGQRDHESEPGARPRYFSGSAAKFNGFHENADALGPDEHAQAAPARRVPASMSAAPADAHPPEEPEHDGRDGYSSDDYYDDTPSPRRRSGLVVVMAVLALAVVGTAGAFAYRAMFGSSLLPTLPPIIKASNGPNKIVPSAGDSQASASTQAGSTSAGSSENLVSHEEQPVDVEPPKAAPRVLSTIPVTTGQGPPPASSAAPMAPASAAAAPIAPSPTPSWVGANAAAPAMASSPPAAPATGTVPPEPKKIHTVTIRPDQAGGSDAMPAPPSPAAGPAARNAARAASSAGKPAAVGSNAPLAIIPGTGGDAAASAPAPARAHTAGAPLAVATTAPATANAAAAPPSGASYAVQVSSQHSESEAQASFQELRAKYPDLLGAREPMIRRADLGAKGVYYRALVGPFGSAEEAAAMCSSLKAAGGHCLIQKN
jgi:SPOR domain